MADSFKMHGEKDAVSFPNLLWGHFREILAGINVEVTLMVLYGLEGPPGIVSLHWRAQLSNPG